MINPSFSRLWNSAVAWGFLATALRFGGNLLVLPLAVRCLPPDHLGLWYVFLSLGVLGGLLDLGFSPAATRGAGYLWGGAARLLPQGVHRSDSRAAAPNLPLLADLTRSLARYYASAGVVVFLLMIAGGGTWIWIKTASLPGATQLRLAYLLFCMGGWLNFQGALWPALLTGINGVRQGQQIFAASLALGYLISAGGLAMGLGLWAMVISFVVQGIVLRRAGRWCYLRMSGVRLIPPGQNSASLLPVLWPNAWRQSLVSVGAFMILHSNTLICSSLLGLATTASYGVSLQLMNMIAAVSSYWVTVKLPVINQLRTSRDQEAIARLFAARVRLTVVTYGAGMAAALLLATPALAFVHGRTLPLPTAQFALLLAIGLLEMHHTQYAYLVLTENVNPFVVPTLVSGVAIVALSLMLTSQCGLWGLLLAPGLVQACFNNWWPVRRAVRGLGEAGRHYWRYLLHPGCA